jgi:NADH-quinone oxidoreductase subunit M
MITLLILVPIAGALIVGALSERLARAIALSVTAGTAIIVALIWQGFDQSAVGFQLVERRPWIPAIGAEYVVGIDGFSLLLLILTSLVFPFAFAAERRGRGFFSFPLLL